MLLFLSNGSGGIGFDQETWRKIPIEYITQVDGGTYIELDCPHYVQDYKYDTVINCFVRIGQCAMLYGITFRNSRKEPGKAPICRGQMVEVGGHNMCVYTEGTGKSTLVFLSGGGTCSTTSTTSFSAPLSSLAVTWRWISLPIISDTSTRAAGDRTVIMKDGFIQQIGTPQEVFDNPVNVFVAG